MSHHQLIYCTRKISRTKRGSHKQIKFRSFKHYTVDLFEPELCKLNFPNYRNFNEAYNDFIQKIMNVIGNVAPMKEKRVKRNSQEWFDGEIADEIKNRDKSKKFKKSKLQIDKDIYNAARCKLQKMIINKIRAFLENKLTESVGKPKYLWKALRSLGLPSSCEVNALKINNKVEHNFNSDLEGFRNYHSTLVKNLVKLLPKPTNKYSIGSVIKYHEHMILDYYFHLASVSENSILSILKTTQVSKAAGIDNQSGRFLKDGAKVLFKPISDLCNLSFTSEKLPDTCKVAKLKPLYKKGSLTEPCNYRLISLLPLISKVIEKVIHDQTSTFLNWKNLLYTYQSGFRKKHSTNFCLSYFNDKILKGFDRGMMTGMILIDLQKIFDTIDNDVLLQKLYAIGFSRRTVNWFKSYPSNSSFKVKLGNNFSQTASVSSGVQESTPVFNICQ